MITVTSATIPTIRKRINTPYELAWLGSVVTILMEWEDLQENSIYEKQEALFFPYRRIGFKCYQA